MEKNILPDTPIQGEFKHLYAQAIAVAGKNIIKRFYITANVLDDEPYVTYDVQIGDKTFTFTTQEFAIKYYNQY